MGFSCNPAKPDKREYFTIFAQDLERVLNDKG